MNYFFTQCENKDFYICNNEKCSVKIKQKLNSGYTNLKNHVEKCTGKDYLEIYNEVCKICKSEEDLQAFGYVNSREKDVYALLEWITQRNIPLSKLDNTITRSMLKTKPLTSKTMRKYILSLLPYVENKIASVLPDKFALEFDGWTSGSTHYIAIFASYCVDGVQNEILLALAPLLNEESLDAEQHIDFIKATLDIFDKKIENVVALIGDNCATNQKISRLTGIPLVGCASHKFNLAVNKWLESNPVFNDIITKVHDIMKELRTLKNAARLRNLTDLCAVQNNVTRWSLNFSMFERFLRIEEDIRKIPESEDHSLMPSRRR